MSDQDRLTEIQRRYVYLDRRPETMMVTMEKDILFLLREVEGMQPVVEAAVSLGQPVPIPRTEHEADEEHETWLSRIHDVETAVWAWLARRIKPMRVDDWIALASEVDDT